MRKRIKKSIVLPAVLFIYTTVMAAYFIPRNHEMDTNEKWITVTASYLIIALLWWVLRKREKMAGQREELSNKQKRQVSFCRKG